MSAEIESLAPKGPELVRPPSARLTWSVLIAGFALNLLPWSPALLVLRPDFVALGLLYWSVRQPLRIGMTVGLVLGLAADVGTGVLLGEHALAYVFTAWAGEAMSRRLLAFKLWQQALQVFPVLFLTELILLVAGMFAGKPVLEWGYLFSAIPGALLWPLLVRLLAGTRRAAPGETA